LGKVGKSGKALHIHNSVCNIVSFLVDVFSCLKQRIIWKWETEDMEGKPDNVLLSKWLPQQDILAHPKLKLFVSHGGQSSCQESLCYQKPMVNLSAFFHLL
jgi:glucuronosyltransferase